LKSCCVLQDHYDNERDKTVFHNTTPDLQDQDQDRFFWSETGLVLKPTVSHITDINSFAGSSDCSIEVKLRGRGTSLSRDQGMASLISYS